jgi:signal transduction histidine kinase
MLHVPKHIEINVLRDLPTVKGDKIKLQQLFQNLISNSIKYNDKEKGIIEIDYTEEEGDYKFSVKDNGIGIHEKHQKNIFKIFHAVNKSKDSTGIGLSIVKKIVELHKGEISVESNLGTSTTFYFTLKK